MIALASAAAFVYYYLINLKAETRTEGTAIAWKMFVVEAGLWLLAAIYLHFTNKNIEKQLSIHLAHHTKPTTGLVRTFSH